MAPEAVAGLRVALSLTVPYLIGVAVDDTARWGLIANGAFLVALCNIGGSFSVRARVSAAAVFAIPAAVFIAELAADPFWIAAVVAVPLVFLSSLTPVLGPRYAFLGLTTAVTFTVYLNDPSGWSEAVEALYLTFGGALWGALLSVAAWPWLRGRPGRQALAAQYRALIAVARCAAEGPGDWRARAATARTDALDLSRGVLDDVLTSPADLRDEMLVLFERSHTVAQRLVLLAERSASGLPPATVEAAAEGCESIAAGLVGTRPWWRWQALRSEEAGLDRCIELADALLAELGSPVAGGDRPRYDRAPASVGDRLRATLWPGSTLFRHGVRLGVTVAAGVVVLGVTDIRDGYWIPLTVLFVLKPDIGGTFDRALQRSIGTIAGGLIGAVIAVVITDELALILLLFPLSWAMRALLPLNYVFWVLAITPLVIVVRDSSDVGDWSLAVWRTGDTLIGIVLALVGGFVLWPSWTRLRLPTAIDRMMSAYRSWTGAVLGDVAAGRAVDEDLGFRPGGQHLDVLDARTNVALAVEQLAREVPRRPDQLAAAQDLELRSLACSDAVITLARRAETGPPIDVASVGIAHDNVTSAFAGGARPVRPATTGDRDLDHLTGCVDDLVDARERLDHVWEAFHEP